MHIRELFQDVISEDLDYEYKTVLNSDKPIKWAKTIVGYANGKGGVVEESCEHYAVIDNEIVWYGSVNLLSKEDAEDNLMRVCSKDIAAELLEMTFGSEAEPQEW